MIRWLVYLPLSWLATLIGWVLSPLVALCYWNVQYSTTVKRYGRIKFQMMREIIVPRLSWFATPDNAADEYWWGMYNEDAPFAFLRNAQQSDYDTSAWIRYCCRVMWLCRNSAYGFQQDVLGRDNSNILYVINRGDVAGRHSTYVKRESSWQYEATIPLRLDHYLSVNIGWKPHKGLLRLMYAGRVIGLRKYHPPGKIKNA